jgi:hypothetical protein
MVERNNSKNIVSEVSKQYLEGVDRIDSLMREDFERYIVRVRGHILLAAAKHLNQLGYNYSSIEMSEDNIVAVDSEIDLGEGEMLTVEGLRDLAHIE